MRLALSLAFVFTLPVFAAISGEELVSYKRPLDPRALGECRYADHLISRAPARPWTLFSVELQNDSDFGMDDAGRRLGKISFAYRRAWWTDETRLERLLRDETSRARRQRLGPWFDAAFANSPGGTTRFQWLSEGDLGDAADAFGIRSEGRATRAWVTARRVSYVALEIVGAGVKDLVVVPTTDLRLKPYTGWTEAPRVRLPSWLGRRLVDVVDARPEGKVRLRTHLLDAEFRRIAAFEEDADETFGWCSHALLDLSSLGRRISALRTRPTELAD